MINIPHNPIDSDPIFSWRGLFTSLMVLALMFMVTIGRAYVAGIDGLGVDDEMMARDEVRNWSRNPSEIADLDMSLASDDYLEPSDRYNFNMVEPSFGNLPLWRIEELDRAAFRRMMFSHVPRSLRRRMNKYVDHALDVAEKRQVDPFWVVAVMWVESHFRMEAVSSANAIGLMQILPSTGYSLSRELNGDWVSRQESDRMLRDPNANTEMGVMYLKYLLERFDGSHKIATVAYNMGPTAISRRLGLGLPVGVSNQYLDKVRRAYKVLSRSFRTYVFIIPAGHRGTYAAHPYVRGKHLSPQQELILSTSFIGGTTLL